MPLPLVPIAITLGITTAASISANIFQGMQNRKLRKQIEMLIATIKNLQSDIEELKKEMKALKLWSFREKLKLHNEISQLKKQIKSKTIDLYKLQKTA